MSSLADVARHAGVSKATASRALSGAREVSPATREKVVASAAELGFVVSSSAASLTTGRTRNIGVVTPLIARWYYGEVIEGIEEALIEAGFDVALFRVQQDPALRSRLFDYFLRRRRVDGVITVSVALSPEDVTSLRALGKPVVGIGGGIPGMSRVSIDDVAASRMATEHLLELGHRRLVHFGGDQLHGVFDFDVHARRLAGFRQATADVGIRDHRHDFHATEFTAPAAHALGLRVLADPQTRPTGIVAASDEIAIGAIVAARELGIRVPEDLSVVGVDDHELAAMFDLTTVRQDPRRQGADAVAVLLGDIGAGEEAPTTDVRAQLKLVVRGSTAPPSA